VDEIGDCSTQNPTNKSMYLVVSLFIVVRVDMLITLKLVSPETNTVSVSPGI